MTESFASIQRLAYLAACLLFILSLRGLSTQQTARRGNLAGIAGMVLAVAVTALACSRRRAHESGSDAEAWGSARGGHRRGRRDRRACSPRASAMTSMPELVAILHSFVGAAAVLVGIANYLEPSAEAADSVHGAGDRRRRLHRRR